MDNNHIKQEPTTQPNQPLPTLPANDLGSEDSKDREGLKSVVSTIAILLLAPILALAITAFVFQSYEVDGPSMENTLQNKDRLIVWKFGHTLSKISGDAYVPQRGSIIVFVRKGSQEFGSGKEKQLIKRVIALPGERIVIKDGKVTVYNDSHPEGFDPDETLGIKDTILGETLDNVDETIDAGEIYVMGDHRNNSMDSRAFGPISTTDIVGTLSARILPLSQAKKF